MAIQRFYSIVMLSLPIWQDAQHQYMAIAQQAGERPALHAVTATEATVSTVCRPEIACPQPASLS